jgi:hypothetical protein
MVAGSVDVGRRHSATQRAMGVNNARMIRRFSQKKMFIVNKDIT